MLVKSALGEAGREQPRDGFDALVNDVLSECIRQCYNYY